MSLIALVSLVFSAPDALGGGRVDPDRVYYGDCEKYTRPAVIDGPRVERSIPAFKEIARRGLTPDDPDYWPLLRKGAQSFRRALREVSRKKGYDLVAQIGSVEGPEVPDITDLVVAEVERRENPAPPPSAQR